MVILTIQGVQRGIYQNDQACRGDGDKQFRQRIHGILEKLTNFGNCRLLKICRIWKIRRISKICRIWKNSRILYFQNSTDSPCIDYEVIPCAKSLSPFILSTRLFIMIDVIDEFVALPFTISQQEAHVFDAELPTNRDFIKNLNDQ